MGIDQPSFEAAPPIGHTHIGGPYWGKQAKINGFTFNFNADNTEPHLLTPMLDQGPGTYCFNFEAELSNGTTQFEEACFEVINVDSTECQDALIELSDQLLTITNNNNVPIEISADQGSIAGDLIIPPNASSTYNSFSFFNNELICITTKCCLLYTSDAADE